ncbi:hypothetical protein K435DRAFT_847430 [Dendrothele bispora CBS 962.96]|uniref:Galactose oxidase n=1 Tax=Dendrothele bispora (strain CBS 962.96) TaxID=1314807 RepID=A0A4S8N0I6_DENBC|nr:hypothetical protein K435DRAFT_847430 [Dendrothele bispora CBS 962.96]
MASSLLFTLTLFYHAFFLLTPVNAQIIATDTPVPPLQWINLTGILQGTNKPPPLKDAAIGYDETSRTIIIFGGESQGGIPQSQTYLLSLDALTWSSPSSPDNLGNSPPARSAALYGNDIAASNRHGFIVIGGKGSDDNALSDEYSYLQQFWSQVELSPGGPSARWSAAGGRDSRVGPIQDPIVPGPNNTFYLAGGFNGHQGEPLSDLWRLNISGTLSSNLPNNVKGSWEQMDISNLPSSVGSANTVISSTVVSSGGCNTSSVTDSTCVTQKSYILNLPSPVTVGGCPAPRRGAAMVSNMNTFTGSFGSQTFLLLGTVDTSVWSDDGGSRKGEVAVLDTNTVVWTRILPSGDPGDSGQEAFPTPREGSAAISSSSALVGGSSGTYSDTLVFGGRDSDGNYLSEVWLLRAYFGSVTPSQPHWSGFGNGQLQSGVNSTGRGVQVQYLTSCATQIASSPASTSTKPTQTRSDSPASATGSPSTTPSASRGPIYDTAITHKILAPLSLALFMPAFLLFRSYSPPYNSHERSPQYIAVVYFSGLLILVSYGLGLAGLATSFTSLSFIPATTSSTLFKRSPSSSNFLQTGHGRAGLAFFLGLYGVVPLLCFWSMLPNRYTRVDAAPSEDDKEEEREQATATSMDTAEKLRTRTARSASQSLNTSSRPASPRHRTHSWGPSVLWRPSHERRVSTDSDSVSDTSPRRAFEVVNRPNRTRRPSAGVLSTPVSSESRRTPSRSLGDIDWLQRRRSVGAVGELDYALTLATRARESPSTPATIDAMLLAHQKEQPDTRPELPNTFQIIIRSLFHVFLLGLSIIGLVALWTDAPKATFIVFLVWLALFYAVLAVQAWYKYPSTSVLATMVTRLRSEPQELPKQSYAPSTTPLEQYPFPTHDGPYVHDPPFRVASDDQSHLGPRSVENDDDDDEDEDARQRRIESEMGRREVSIVTTQLKRKLWVTNPS